MQGIQSHLKIVGTFFFERKQECAKIEEAKCGYVKFNAKNIKEDKDGFFMLSRFHSLPPRPIKDRISSSSLNQI